jgi:hypothetical protein
MGLPAAGRRSWAGAEPMRLIQKKKELMRKVILFLILPQTPLWLKANDFNADIHYSFLRRFPGAHFGHPGLSLLKGDLGPRLSSISSYLYNRFLAKIGYRYS